jgi:hypothetical protein
MQISVSSVRSSSAHQNALTAAGADFALPAWDEVRQLLEKFFCALRQIHETAAFIFPRSAILRKFAKRAKTTTLLGRKRDMVSHYSSRRDGALLHPRSF